MIFPSFRASLPARPPLGNLGSATNKVVLIAVLSALAVSGCANFKGISDGNKIARPDDFATRQSIEGSAGNWPAVDWIAQFGDPQLSALIDEAMASSPTLQQAQARINAANAAAEGRGAALLPSINAQASYIRNRFSETSIYPPPFGGSWFNSKSALLSLSYELDLWGKNQAALAQAVSQQKAAQASAQQARLALASSIAATYNQLAAEYALQDILHRTVTQRGTLQKITANRVQNGLDSQVEHNVSVGSEADARAQVAENEGQIIMTRQQLGALLGKGPDRGMQIQKPQVAVLSTPALPDDLPLNLLGRRPDIVAARWQVEAAGSGITAAKARFYPDINLSASIGFESLLNANPFTAASRAITFGPAISLPIFDAGALRANLKGQVAAYDLAVANYNQTLNDAYADVAHQIAAIHSIDAQLPIRREALAAAQRGFTLAQERYRLGLTSQLVTVNAETTLLSEQQILLGLEVNRRNQQIGLFKALGGGFDAAAAGLDQKHSASQANQ
ncbi:MAG: MarR family transcriptional regulator [Herbaspirillum sp.]|nr:MarR family transcriptional regulator [Herbaspirillum sp.]